ncbi:Putative heat shock protein YegD [hydrothermal vent metagenome]|uniref:Putative heat shock protein YegD n=1 Tax=hydrothermal vent metagenome TaxID=652676 RepID=A0A1W1CQS2_9ZZZZ
MISSAIDFGTTNSVAGINLNNKVEMIHLGQKSIETRSVLFYSFEKKGFYVGDDVLTQLDMDTEGRYLQSLKSFLGHKENIETILGTDTYYLDDLISIILRRFKQKMDKKAEESIENLVLGRPVRFNDDSDSLDKEAQNRLESAGKKAGFKNIVFQYEPIAAALSYEDKINKEELILVADIGGGTTDYSVIKVGGNSRHKADRKEDILSNHGVYVGGNSFDSSIIKEFIAPYLGQGTIYKSMGREMEVPYELYYDLSEWHLFQRMFDRKVLTRIDKLMMMAYEKDKIERLHELITDNLYFDFANEIVNTKITLSSADKAKLDMKMFYSPFAVDLTLNEFENSITPYTQKIEEALTEALKQANVTVEQIDKVFLTGGSTLVPSVKQIYSNYFSKDKIFHTDVFSSVGYGLTLYANRFRF